MVRPGDRKNVVSYLGQTYQVSIRRACKAINLPKSIYYYESVHDDSDVVNKLRELAGNKSAEGQDKLYARIRQQGYNWNYKTVRRVYLLMGLNKRSKRRKRLPARVKEPLIQAEELNRSRSMNFMHDTLMNGRKFQRLISWTIVIAKLWPLKRTSASLLRAW